MTRHQVKTVLSVLLVITFSAILFILLTHEPQVAWNDGACEKLSKALKEIGCKLYLQRTDARGGRPELDVSDFVPRSREQNAKPPLASGKSLATRHGVSVHWRRNGVWKKLLFYPIALSQKLVIDPQSDAATVPLMVMVPVDEEDIESLPNLSGCRDVAAEEIWDRQFRRMKSLFSKHGMEYAATLRSDGSSWWMPVAELETCIPKTRQPMTEKPNNSSQIMGK